MSKELVRVYNKKGIRFDNYINRKLLPIKGFYFNLINVWIIDENKNILIQQRSELKDLFPNQFECVAGAVIENETLLEASIREVKEELNIDLLPNQMEKVYFNVDHKICYFMTTYFAKIKKIDINKIKFNEDEVKKIQIVNLKQLQEMIKKNMFTYDIKMRFKKLKPHFKKHLK